MSPTFWCTLIFICIGGSLFAQQFEGPYLLLKKSGSTKQVIFNEGDEIRYRIRGEDYFRKSLILGLREDSVRFHYFNVAIRDFEVIDIRGMQFQRFHFDSGGVKVIMAGMLFLAGDYINQKLIQDEPGGLSAQTWAISGGLVGVGLLMQLFQKRNFRPGGRYVIDIIDLRNN